jgi:hypothetical protein
MKDVGLRSGLLLVAVTVNSHQPRPAQRLKSWHADRVLFRYSQTHGTATQVQLDNSGKNQDVPRTVLNWAPVLGLPSSP